MSPVRQPVEVEINVSGFADDTDDLAEVGDRLNTVMGDLLRPGLGYLITSIEGTLDSPMSWRATVMPVNEPT